MGDMTNGMIDWIDERWVERTSQHITFLATNILLSFLDCTFFDIGFDRETGKGGENVCYDSDSAPTLGRSFFSFSLLFLRMVNNFLLFFWRLYFFGGKCTYGH